MPAPVKRALQPLTSPLPGGAVLPVRPDARQDAGRGGGSASRGTTAAPSAQI